jgi:hypothetical protein
MPTATDFLLDPFIRLSANKITMIPETDLITMFQKMLLHNSVTQIRELHHLQQRIKKRIEQ